MLADTNWSCHLKIYSRHLFCWVKFARMLTCRAKVDLRNHPWIEVHARPVMYEVMNEEGREINKAGQLPTIVQLMNHLGRFTDGRVRHNCTAIKIRRLISYRSHLRHVILGRQPHPCRINHTAV